MALTGDANQGPLYCALNPVYARMPLPGRGAELYGGRFNPKGTPALYSALDPVTALRETNRVGSLQPTILVSYRADVAPVIDLICSVSGTWPSRSGSTELSPSRLGVNSRARMWDVAGSMAR